MWAGMSCMLHIKVVSCKYADKSQYVNEQFHKHIKQQTQKD